MIAEILAHISSKKPIIFLLDFLHEVLYLEKLSRGLSVSEISA
jgi:hypothetical protein